MDDILEEIKGILYLENPKNLYITRCYSRLVNTFSSLNGSKRTHRDDKDQYLVEQLDKRVET